jgi:LDH2 family malate/lactate/ureidoglycolate dehydrogenase
MQPAPNAGKPFIERSTNNSAVLNANQAPGMLAAVMGADQAIELCLNGNNTIAVVGTHNTSTSSGQLAFYAECMARKGLVGLCFANSPEMVAAAQGGKAVFGTNPLSVGVPQAAADPFVVSTTICDNYLSS